MAEILAGSSNAASVNLTTSDTSKASSTVYVKGATFSGSNSSSSAHSVRFYSQYKNSAGDYANDQNCKVGIGKSCPRTSTYKFASKVYWRLLLKPNALNAKDCTASGTIS